MGCGSSNGVDPNIGNKLEKKPSSLSQARTTQIRVNSAESRIKSADSGLSLRGSTRGGSAGSKKSKCSADSGIGTEERDAERERIANMFSGTSEGNPLALRQTASGKVRPGDESDIIASLRDEGLISRPKSVAGGLSFDIMDTENVSRRPPPRLLKLTKPEKKPMTEEEIQAKLERADKRRKKHEAQRVRKSVELAALEQFATRQKTRLESVSDCENDSTKASIDSGDIMMPSQDKALLNDASEIATNKQFPALAKHPSNSTLSPILETGAGDH